MKILILGATGPTGLQLVTQALEQHYEVTALVRNPAKFNINPLMVKPSQTQLLHRA